jgi:phosphoenolpyruvate carboxykinase (GTP)
MKPFAGYNFADYWAHWLNVGAKLKSPPQIFHVNWFRQDQSGKFLWPGFGENLRVLRWIVDRCAGKADARETAIGFMPSVEDLDTRGLNISADALTELLSVDAELWKKEFDGIGAYLAEFGERLPQALKSELAQAQRRLQAT